MTCFHSWHLFYNPPYPTLVVLGRSTFANYDGRYPPMSGEVFGIH